MKHETASSACFFLAAFLAKAFSSPVAVLHNWEDRLALDNREAAVLSGDSPEYAAPGFDDCLARFPFALPGDLSALKEAKAQCTGTSIRLPEGYPQRPSA